MPSPTAGQAPLPISLPTRDRYGTPLVLGLVAVSNQPSEQKSPIQFLLHLEGGYELEVPLTQQAIDQLAAILWPIQQQDRD